MTEQAGQQSVFCLTRRDVNVLNFKKDHGKLIQRIGFYLTKPLRGNIWATLESGNKVSSTNAKANELPPPGCSRVKVELSKPLGIVLEEDKAGNIFVAEVFEGGNADKSGLVDVGDQLIATSAIVYGSEDYYQGVRVRKGMQVVRLSVLGEKFDTVSSQVLYTSIHLCLLGLQ
ncbi:hypothetical protein GOP47_0013423 [Adiantum capillus-veneris]|uniref:PDZ domain-containing protein n=1 Tax=Adiantum capillus-veneris TaxID=13818 RepID=A0A9D4UPG0_ADICA|nr:hypothetical protein GOP47_0013423 [Adiantum capillus-veneris]